ncbi:hypothetical protein AVEN_128614-1 [Araneus ventricosus]|uniref:Uncharacterized protein n=1 Tax=Araneus ventricosus TaxID=182803 RepID=A0A4Y2NN03_ARAVE|nr:hypothetical protein AVEN_128614-1 [Araneus ventricosus]
MQTLLFSSLEKEATSNCILHQIFKQNSPLHPDVLDNMPRFEVSIRYLSTCHKCQSSSSIGTGSLLHDIIENNNSKINPLSHLVSSMRRNVGIPNAPEPEEIKIGKEKVRINRTIE